MFLEHKEQGEPSREPQVKPLDAASKLLLDAADVIERHGWCQNALQDRDGRVCLEGALYVANGDLRGGFVDITSPGVDEAMRRVRKSVGQTAYGWNDRPGRTKEEVVAKLRAVALGG